MRSFGLPQGLECYRRAYLGQCGDRQNGFLAIPKRGLTVIFSDGEGWEHVSASHPDRCPSWETMAWLKDQFWDPEATVLQIHPPRSTYVNAHPFCLHLWRQVGAAIELPPTWMLGPVSDREAIRLCGAR